MQGIGCYFVDWELLGTEGFVQNLHAEALTLSVKVCGQGACGRLDEVNTGATKMGLVSW